MARYVEFFGPAGSGKTTAYRPFRKSLQSNRASFQIIEDRALEVLPDEVKPHERLLLRFGMKRQARARLKLLPENVGYAKHRAFLEFCGSHPEFAALLFDNTATRISVTTRDELPVLGWTLELLASYQLSRNNPGNLALLLREHGFGQIGLSLIAYRVDESEQYAEDLTQRYYTAMPVPDIAVVLKTSVDAILARLAGRGFPKRMDAMSNVQKRISIERAVRATETASQILAQRGARIVALENAGSREQLAVQMAALAKELG
jgi:thymidylate kinase